MTDPEAQPRELETFVVQLGAALNGSGVPVNVVEARLRRVAAAYGATDARISAFPTSLLLTMALGTSATLELPTDRSGLPRLDQTAAVDRLVATAERGEVAPTEGLRQLGEIRRLPHRFHAVVQLLGYSVMTVGLCLILDPSGKDVAVAAVLGVLVGVLRLIAQRDRALQVLIPVLAAFAVSSVSALAIQASAAAPGLRAMIAALVIFLPGAALTTAVWELTEGQMIAGSSRLVWAGVQLTLLAFGILAGVEAVGISTAEAFIGSPALLGAWAPWVGVLLFAVGVAITHSAPPKSFLALLIVLYTAWVGQFLGGLIFGGLVSGMVGALVMTPAAYLLARTRIGMPAFAMFLPGFWLLVPGALSLIGVTGRASDAASAVSDSTGAAAASVVGVVLGVLCGSVLLQWISAGARRVTAARQT